MSTIATTEDLANGIKGLGPAKADLIQKHIDSGADITVDALSSIKGVSVSLARRVVAYLETHAEPAPAPQEAPEVAETNGHKTFRTAGEARRFAREMEAYGYLDQAEELRIEVSALLDDETLTGYLA